MSRLHPFVLTLTVTAVPVAFAENSAVEVHFDRGAHAKEIRSSIKGDDSADYLVPLQQGQVMLILFAPIRGSCYFNVWEPGNPQTAIHHGPVAGNEFGASPTKAGTYRVQVFQMRATARRNETCRYSISFEVTGDGTQGRPAATSEPLAAAEPPAAAQGACLYKIGNEASIVGSNALEQGKWEIIMKTRQGKRKVACTVSDSGKISSWVEVK
jgi:hypothetical protein